MHRRYSARMSPKAAEVMEQPRQLTEEERRGLAIELLDSAEPRRLELRVQVDGSRRSGVLKRGKHCGR